MQSKVIIVYGHESAGCRLITGALASAGGYKDITRIKQNTMWSDISSIEYQEDKRIISLRSAPSFGFGEGRSFENVFSLIPKLEEVGYDVRVVLPTRDRSCAQNSRVRKYKKDNSEILEECGKGYREVLDTEMVRAVEEIQALLEGPHSTIIWSYETFMLLGEPYLQHLYKFCGIESRHMPKLHDGNLSYIEME